MNNRTESVLKDFCKKVSDGTITNPVNTDYDKLFEMMDESDESIRGYVISECNKDVRLFRQQETKIANLKREVADGLGREQALVAAFGLGREQALLAALPPLIEEAANMKNQYGCDCGHLHCRVCADTKTLAIAIDGAEKAIQPEPQTEAEQIKDFDKYMGKAIQGDE